MISETSILAAKIYELQRKLNILSAGMTAPLSHGTQKIRPLVPPRYALTATDSGVAGNPGTGLYNYVVTFTDLLGGETTAGEIGSVTTGGNNKITLTDIPVGAPTVTGRKIYRTVVGGAGNYLLVTTINDNTTTTYTDDTADGALGAAAPATNTTGGLYSNGALQSLVPTGTVPILVTSITMNPNLNADLLDGFHASDFALSSFSNDVYRFGFLDNNVETSLSYNDGTYLFTLTSVGASWSYYRAGVKYTIAGNKTVSLGAPPAAGTYFIYIDAVDGTLSSSTSSWTLNDTKVPVAIIIWNASNTPKYWLMDERHTVLVDRRWHRIHHYTEGTMHVSGGEPGDYTVGGSTDDDNTFSLTEAEIADEDLFHTLAALADPSGAGSDYVIFYRSGGSWTWEYSAVPFRYTAAGYIQYDNAGAMTEGQNGDYYNTYLLFTNLTGAARFVIIHGRGEFANANAAYAEDINTFDFTGFPIAECVAAYQFTWGTNAALGTKGKCRLTRIPVQLNISLTSVVGTGGSIDHNSLASLQGGSAGSYYHLTVTQHTDLTDGGDSALHYHATDRDLTNATNKTALKLDDLGTPDNNTDLNVSITAHGLCPILPNDAAKFLSGVGTWLTVSATVADGSITLAKMANLTDQRIIGRAAGTDGVPQALTVTGTGGVGLTLATGALTASIADSAITLAKIANTTDQRILGRAAGSDGVTQQLTVSGSGGITATLATGALSLTIADAALSWSKLANITANYLVCRAAGTDGGVNPIEILQQRIVGRITGGNIAGLTGAQAAGILPNVGAAAGLCPASPSDTAKFLRGDATPSWSTLPVAAGAMPLQPTTDIIINDTGGDFNITYEGDTNANLLVFDAGNNNIGIGAAPAATSSELGVLQVTAGTSQQAISVNCITGGHGIFIHNSSAEGAASGGVLAVEGDITPSAADKRIGVLDFRAITTGSTTAASGRIRVYSAAAWGSGDASSYMTFATTPVGSATAVEAMRIESTKNVTFAGTITANATSIITDTTTGLKIGSAAAQKVAFHNATPVVQAAHIADPSGGATVDSQSRAAINAILVVLENKGLTALA